MPWLFAVLLGLAACSKTGPLSAPAATSSSASPRSSKAGPRTSASSARAEVRPEPSASSGVTGPEVRIADLIEAEYRRDSQAISESDLGRRDPRVRRAAARALAQILDERALGLLGRALGDEDTEVVAWATFGLGAACRSRETKTVHALVSRAASLALSPPPRAAGSGLDLDAAFSDALARCASSEAEATLRAWLRGPGQRANKAAFGLGRIAAQNSRLDDASVVALLEASARPDGPTYALYPFTRLGALGEAAEERLAELLGPALSASDIRRSLAVRALGKSGQHAAERLGKVVTDRSFTASDRATAARELARLGEAGQRALAQALEGLMPRDSGWHALLGPEFGPLRATLEALGPEAARRLRAVQELGGLELPEDASTALKRRLVRLRCRAAVLLAGRAYQDKRVVGCDPDPQGRTGALAQLEVLGLGELRGPRERRWRAWLGSQDRVVREAALALLPSHPEVVNAGEVLASALRAKDDGTVAAAAQILGAYPDRASGAAAGPDGGLRPSTSLGEALADAFAANRPADAVQRRAALIDAAGALQLLSLKPTVDAYCSDPNATLRSHAEKALRLLGEGGKKCGPVPLARAFKFDRHPAGRHVRLKLVTDAGTRELVLDPTWAPAAVGRVVDLARAGFYTGTVIHRVVPGFVVQFGDPGQDGYGGAGRQPVPSETAPVTFGRLAVGLAAAGRDTGSSQLFVTLGEFPHLESDYAWIGSAEQGWEGVAEGDVIQRLEVIE